MIWGIRAKLGVLLAGFSILAVGVTGYYAYVTSRSLLLDAAHGDMLTTTQVLGRNLQLSIEAIGRDTRMLAALQLSTQIARKASATATEKTALADAFTTMLAVHPEYSQIRLISVDRRELVRVERVNNVIARVGDADLAWQDDLPSAFEVRHLQTGLLDFSAIAVSRKSGARLLEPILQVLSPVIGRDGVVIGMLALHINMNVLFNRFREQLPLNYQLYLSNEWGDFLLHPDANHLFEHGQRLLIQDAFAPVAALLEGQQEALVMDIDAYQREIAGFVRLPFGALENHRFVVFGVARPLGDVMGQTMGWHTLQIVLLFSVLALLFSFWVSRAATRYLHELVQVVARFSREHVISAVPRKRSDELGLLACSVHIMQVEIIEHLAELNENQKTLEHLAGHDVLTGQLNRMLLSDRVQHAVVYAKRNKSRMALMLLDLDKFKAINDTHGHRVGDLLLQAAAMRIAFCTRESDSVGRIGGDEFVVLLTFIKTEKDALMVAEKIRIALTEVFELDGKRLHISTSIGIAFYPEHGDDEIALSINADAAMYQAKQSGRNQIAIFQSSVLETMQDLAVEL